MLGPALATCPSGESEHPAYLAPPRRPARVYAPDLDRLPHLIVATALEGLKAGGPALWDRYDNGDNLLFCEADFKSPSTSKLMRELWQTGTPAVQSLVGRLALACGRPIPQTPWLDLLAPEGEPAPLEAEVRRDAAAALGLSLPVVAIPWSPADPAEPLPLPELVP